jgi:hypothetical protein
MPLSTDTTRAAAVSEATQTIAATLFPGASATFIRQAFDDVERLFSGGWPDYRANDLKYHDFQHTLQVTMAYVDLVAARQKADQPPLSPRQFELGLVSALLHDSGYLKLRSDHEGSGAKYTYCHVLRSCALAASYLPALGLTLSEIEIVLGAIRRTDPDGLIPQRNHEEDALLACAVASADYLAQMADPAYPNKLPLLFDEFTEADNFLRVPPARRVFPSAAALIASTPAFWETVVRPKLDRDFLGLYRFLTTSDGVNPYLDAIEHNLGAIARDVPSAS